MSLFTDNVCFFSPFRCRVGLRNDLRNKNEKCLSVLTVELFVTHVLLNVAVKFKFHTLQRMSSSLGVFTEF